MEWKNHLIRASFPVINNILDSEPCGKNYQVCQFFVNANSFRSITTDKTFEINEAPGIINSEKVAYLWKYKKFKM